MVKRSIGLAGAFFAGAMPLMAYDVSNGVLTVGTGETVTFTTGDEAVVAALTEISFSDSAGVVELCDSEFELAAAVSGAGLIKATQAAGLTVSGDSRGFTGGWVFSNSVVTVSSRYGLGDANTLGACSSGGFDYGVYVRDTTANTSPITFRGNGLTNDVSVYVYRDSPAMTYFNYDEPGVWVQNGRLTNYKCGKIYLANVTFNGVYESKSQTFYYMKPGAEIIFNSPSIFTGGGTWWYRNGSGAKPKIRFNATGNTMTEINFSDGHEVYAGAVDFFPGSGGATTRICLEQSAYIDLQGHDQTCTMIARKQLATEANASVETVTSSVPATVTVVAGATSREYHSAAMYCGAASLRYNSPTTFRLITGKSVTKGFLEVADGVFYIDWGAQWAGTNVTVTGGQLVLNSPNSLLDDTSSLVVASPGVLTIADGVTAFVSEAAIGGVEIAAGVYTADSLASAYPSTAGLVSGSGVLAVGQNAPEAEEEFASWTGGAADTLLQSDDNWAGGSAPDFTTGGAVLTFSGNVSGATVDGDPSVKSLVFELSRNFEFSGTPGSVLSLGSGGISTTNVLDGATPAVTNVISADIVNSLTSPGDISVAAGVVLRLAGSYSGGSGGNTVTVRSAGEIIVEGDNGDLASPLFFRPWNGDSDTASPFFLRVRHPRALGATNRATTIVSPYIRFECLTNDVPICVKGYGMVKYEYDGSSVAKRMIDPGRTLVLNGQMSSYGDIFGRWNMDGVTVRGGIVSNGGPFGIVVTPGGETHIESAVNLTAATKQYHFVVQGGGDVYLSPAEHEYFRIAISDDTRLVCVGDDALLPGFPVCFGISTEPEGRLDLNGTDQEATYVSHLIWSDNHSVEYGSVTSGDTFGTVTSATPATLTLNGILTSDQSDKNGDFYTHPTNAAVRFSGYAGLHFAGSDASAVQVLSFVPSDSHGDLRVSAGKLSFDRGAGWSGARDVLVDGSGVLETDAESASVLFGKGAGLSRANLRIGGDGSLRIPSGAEATVRTLKIGDTDDVQFLPAGVYGGPAAGLDSAHTLSCMTGAGTLRVRAGGPGCVLLFR